MIDKLKNIIDDLKHGRFIESYIVIAIALIVALIDVFDLSNPSWVTGATLAVLALLAYSNIESSRTLDEVNTKLKLARDGHHFEASHEVDVLQVNRRIESAKTVDWVAFTNQKTVNTYRTYLSKCLSNGGKIRILLINPHNDMPKTISKNGYSVTDNIEQYYKSGVLYTLQFCEYLKKESPQGTIEIRFLRVHPPFRLAIYNRGHKDAFIRLHVLKAPNSPEAATIAWWKDDDPRWFQFFVDQYELLWQNSDAIDGSILVDSSSVAEQN